MASSSLSFLLALALLGGAFAQSFTCANSDNSTVCTALSTFYTATGGASWTTKTGWGTGTSYCTPWYGLTCTSGNIVKMDFSTSSNNLVGTLPDIWNSLSSSLTRFQASSTQLTGTLPPTFFNLKATYFIGGSGLTGTVPYIWTVTTASLAPIYGGNYLPSSLVVDFSSLTSGSGSSSSFDPTALQASIAALNATLQSSSPFNSSQLQASLAALNNTQLTLAATAAGQNSSLGTQQTQLNALVASNAAMNTTNLALIATNTALNATTATLQAQYTQLASLVTALQVNLTAARAAISAAG
jgi:hypothetical protein